MKESNRRRTGRLWAEGLLLAALRLMQNQTGFDPATGLSRPSAPGTALIVCVALILVGELVLAFRRPPQKGSYVQLFAPPEKELTAAVVGCMLLAAGGVLLLVRSIPERRIAAIAAGVLAAASGAGLLLLLRQVRAGERPDVLPSLPAAFFGVCFVLAVYLPTDTDPVLARYYLPVLAAAMAAYSFGVLAGFLVGESSTRTFAFTAGTAVPLCVAAVADGLDTGVRLLFAGCAVVLTVFLALRRDPSPAPAENGGGEPA